VRRLSAITAALACAFILPAASAAAARSGSQHARVAGAAVHLATGAVIDSGPYEVTIQTNGRPMGVINAMTATATRITRQDYSYIWGGGHAEAGVASLGVRGPGYTGRTSGYDCSGSVAAVLAGGGLWPAGGGVPNDAGVISELLAEHIIARGPGTGASEVTLYDDPGVHIFMNIDGRFFGTSDGAGGGSKKGGPGWLDDGAADAFDHVFRQYHILPSVLRDRTSYGHDLTFQTTADPALAAAVELGDRIHVGYSNAAAGRMMLRALSYVGSRTASGVVASLSAGAIVITPAAGAPLALTVPGTGSLLSAIAPGDTVSITYTNLNGVVLLRSAIVTAQPAPPPTMIAPTTTTTTAPAPAPPTVSDPSQTTTDPSQTPGPGGGYAGPVWPGS
jgi:hypothetical protein